MSPKDSVDSKSLREVLRSRMHHIPSSHLKQASGKNTSSLVKHDSEDSGVKKSSFLDVKMMLHERLLNHLEKKKLLASFEEREIKKAVRDFVGQVADKEDFPMNQTERERLVQELSDETLGVGPLATLMTDPAVTDILVNAPDLVFVERYGKLEKTDIKFRDAEHLLRLIQRIVSSIGRRIDESSPYVDARLPDGSRVNATMPPVTIDGPTLSIRRFGHNRLRSEDLITLSSLSVAMLEFLKLCIIARKNIAISGGAGAGKSTMMSALAEFIPEDERIITIEDTVELVLNQEHVVRCETRPPNIEGQGEIQPRQLVRNALRMRPDRIIVGEVRGAEAFDMLQAMNTGHEGSMTTLHANSPRDALTRLESMVLMTGIELPSSAIREQFVSALDLLIHVERDKSGSRRVTSIVEFIGLEGGVPQTQEIFKYKHSHRGGQLSGSFEATGVVPRFVEDMVARGFEMPMHLFRQERRR